MTRPDVVVVGGGVIGLATGYELVRRGLGVLLLEQGRVGGGTSAAGGGFVSLLGQTAPAMVSLVRDSLRQYQELGAERPAGLGLRGCGTLALAATPAEAAALESHRAALSELDVRTEALDRSDWTAAEPRLAPGLTAAIYGPQDLQIEPDRVLRGYREAFEQLGGEVRENRMVHDLQRTGDRVRGVRTQYGDLDAEHVVLATGSWTPALLPPTYAAFIRPRHGQAFVSAAHPRCLNHLLLSAEYLAARRTGRAVGFALEQTVDGPLRLGSTLAWAGFDGRPRPCQPDLLTNAGHYFRLPAELTWSRVVAGLRPATADGRPLIGALSRGLWLAAGHDGCGFATAPATAQRLAAAIAGAPVDLRAFLPQRFMTPIDGER